MSYWRKFFLVVLLALSLPVQSFAAVSMNCESSQAGHDGAYARDIDGPKSTDIADAGGVQTAARMPRAHHQEGDAQHLSACSACAVFCCAGAVLPASLASTDFDDAARFAIPLPPSIGGAFFLTGGIERPPRLILD
jgi:hypothetical protein